MVTDSNTITIHVIGTSAGTISDTTSTACTINDPAMVFTLTKKDAVFGIGITYASKHKGKSRRWKYQNR